MGGSPFGHSHGGFESAFGGGGGMGGKSFVIVSPWRLTDHDI